MFKLTTRTLTMVAAIAVATVPSTASARIAYDPQTPADVAAPFSPAQQVSSSQGFHLGDAVIGAAGMLVLLCAGATLALIVRRRGGRSLGSRVGLGGLL